MFPTRLLPLHSNLATSLRYSKGIRSSNHPRFFSTTPIEPTLSYLRNDSKGSEVWLVGTMHISKKSAEQVVEVPLSFHSLAGHQPSEAPNSDGFFSLISAYLQVELDIHRAQNLMRGKDIRSNFKLPSLQGAAMLGNIFRLFYKMLESYGITPGEEFSNITAHLYTEVAMARAKELNLEIVYGDIESSKTLQGIWNSISMPQLLQMVTNPKGPIHHFPKINPNNIDEWMNALEELKTRENVRQLTQFLRSNLPGVAKALIDERDVFMAEQLFQCRGTTVGVVGLAHLDGIENHWKQLNLKRIKE